MIKPSRKLSLIYSGISILMMTVVGVVVYIVTSGSIQDIYYDYLDDKAELLAIEHFEKNTIDTTSYANVVRRLQNTIPTSKELFINLTDTSKANVLLHRYLDSKEIASLYNPDIETVHFQYGKEVGSALLYQDQTAAYGVLVMSANPYGASVDSDAHSRLAAAAGAGQPPGGGEGDEAHRHALPAREDVCQQRLPRDQQSAHGHTG